MIMTVKASNLGQVFIAYFALGFISIGLLFLTSQGTIFLVISLG